MASQNNYAGLKLAIPIDGIDLAADFCNEDIRLQHRFERRQAALAKMQSRMTDKQQVSFGNTIGNLSFRMGMGSPETGANRQQSYVFGAAPLTPASVLVTPKSVPPSAVARNGATDMNGAADPASAPATVVRTRGQVSVVLPQKEVASPTPTRFNVPQFPALVTVIDTSKSSQIARATPGQSASQSPTMMPDVPIVSSLQNSVRSNSHAPPLSQGDGEANANNDLETSPPSASLTTTATNKYDDANDISVAGVTWAMPPEELVKQAGEANLADFGGPLGSSSNTPRVDGVGSAFGSSDAEDTSNSGTHGQQTVLTSPHIPAIVEKQPAVDEARPAIAITVERAPQATLLLGDGRSPSTAHTNRPGPQFGVSVEGTVTGTEASETLLAISPSDGEQEGPLANLIEEKSPAEPSMPLTAEHLSRIFVNRSDLAVNTSPLVDGNNLVETFDVDTNLSDGERTSGHDELQTEDDDDDDGSESTVSSTASEVTRQQIFQDKKLMKQSMYNMTLASTARGNMSSTGGREAPLVSSDGSVIITGGSPRLDAPSGGMGSSGSRGPPSAAPLSPASPPAFMGSPSQGPLSSTESLANTTNTAAGPTNDGSPLQRVLPKRRAPPLSSASLSAQASSQFEPELHDHNLLSGGNTTPRPDEDPYRRTSLDTPASADRRPHVSQSPFVLPTPASKPADARGGALGGSNNEDSIRALKLSDMGQRMDTPMGRSDTFAKGKPTPLMLGGDPQRSSTPQSPLKRQSTHSTATASPRLPADQQPTKGANHHQFPATPALPSGHHGRTVVPPSSVLLPLTTPLLSGRHHNGLEHSDDEDDEYIEEEEERPLTPVIEVLIVKPTARDLTAEERAAEAKFKGDIFAAALLASKGLAAPRPPTPLPQPQPAGDMRQPSETELSNSSGNMAIRVSNGSQTQMMSSHQLQQQLGSAAATLAPTGNTLAQPAPGLGTAPQDSYYPTFVANTHIRDNPYFAATNGSSSFAYNGFNGGGGGNNYSFAGSMFGNGPFGNNSSGALTRAPKPREITVYCGNFLKELPIPITIVDHMQYIEVEVRKLYMASADKDVQMLKKYEEDQAKEKEEATAAARLAQQQQPKSSAPTTPFTTKRLLENFFSSSKASSPEAGNAIAPSHPPPLNTDTGDAHALSATESAPSFNTMTTNDGALATSATAVSTTTAPGSPAGPVPRMLSSIPQMRSSRGFGGRGGDKESKSSKPLPAFAIKIKISDKSVVHGIEIIEAALAQLFHGSEAVSCTTKGSTQKQSGGGRSASTAVGTVPTNKTVGWDVSWLLPGGEEMLKGLLAEAIVLPQQIWHKPSTVSAAGIGLNSPAEPSSPMQKGLMSPYGQSTPHATFSAASPSPPRANTNNTDCGVVSSVSNVLSQQLTQQQQQLPTAAQIEALYAAAADSFVEDRHREILQAYYRIAFSHSVRDYAIWMADEYTGEEESPIQPHSAVSASFTHVLIKPLPIAQRYLFPRFQQSFFTSTRGVLATRSSNNTQNSNRRISALAFIKLESVRDETLQRKQNAHIQTKSILFESSPDNNAHSGTAVTPLSPANAHDQTVCGPVNPENLGTASNSGTPEPVARKVFQETQPGSSLGATPPKHDSLVTLVPSKNPPATSPLSATITPSAAAAPRQPPTLPTTEITEPPLALEDPAASLITSDGAVTDFRTVQMRIVHFPPDFVAAAGRILRANQLTAALASAGTQLSITTTTTTKVTNNGSMLSSDVMTATMSTTNMKLSATAGSPIMNIFNNNSGGGFAEAFGGSTNGVGNTVNSLQSEFANTILKGSTSSPNQKSSVSGSPNGGAAASHCTLVLPPIAPQMHSYYASLCQSYESRLRILASNTGPGAGAMGSPTTAGDIVADTNAPGSPIIPQQVNPLEQSYTAAPSNHSPTKGLHGNNSSSSRPPHHAPTASGEGLVLPHSSSATELSNMFSPSTANNSLMLSGYQQMAGHAPWPRGNGGHPTPPLPSATPLFGNISALVQHGGASPHHHLHHSTRDSSSADLHLSRALGGALHTLAAGAIVSFSHKFDDAVRNYAQAQSSIAAKEDPTYVGMASPFSVTPMLHAASASLSVTPVHGRTESYGFGGSPLINPAGRSKGLGGFRSSNMDLFGESDAHPLAASSASMAILSPRNLNLSPARGGGALMATSPMAVPATNGQISSLGFLSTTTTKAPAIGAALQQAQQNMRLCAKRMGGDYSRQDITAALYNVDGKDSWATSSFMQSKSANGTDTSNAIVVIDAPSPFYAPTIMPWLQATSATNTGTTNLSFSYNNGSIRRTPSDWVSTQFVAPPLSPPPPSVDSTKRVDSTGPLGPNISDATSQHSSQAISTNAVLSATQAHEENPFLTSQSSNQPIISTSTVGEAALPSSAGGALDETSGNIGRQRTVQIHESALSSSGKPFAPLRRESSRTIAAGGQSNNFGKGHTSKDDAKQLEDEFLHTHLQGLVEIALAAADAVQSAAQLTPATLCGAGANSLLGGSVPLSNVANNSLNNNIGSSAFFHHKREQSAGSSGIVTPVPSMKMNRQLGSTPLGGNLSSLKPPSSTTHSTKHHHNPNANLHLLPSTIIPMVEEYGNLLQQRSTTQAITTETVLDPARLLDVYREALYIKEQMQAADDHNTNNKALRFKGHHGVPNGGASTAQGGPANAMLSTSVVTGAGRFSPSAASATASHHTRVLSGQDFSFGVLPPLSSPADQNQASTSTPPALGLLPPPQPLGNVSLPTVKTIVTLVAAGHPSRTLPLIPGPLSLGLVAPNTGKDRDALLGIAAPATTIGGNSSVVGSPLNNASMAGMPGVTSGSNSGAPDNITSANAAYALTDLNRSIATQRLLPTDDVLMLLDIRVRLQPSSTLYRSTAQTHNGNGIVTVRRAIVLPPELTADQLELHVLKDLGLDLDLDLALKGAGIAPPEVGGSARSVDHNFADEFDDCDDDGGLDDHRHTAAERQKAKQKADKAKRELLPHMLFIRYGPILELSVDTPFDFFTAPDTSKSPDPLMAPPPPPYLAGTNGTPALSPQPLTSPDRMFRIQSNLAMQRQSSFANASMVSDDGAAHQQLQQEAIHWHLTQLAQLYQAHEQMIADVNQNARQSAQLFSPMIGDRTIFSLKRLGVDTLVLDLTQLPEDSLRFTVSIMSNEDFAPVKAFNNNDSLVVSGGERYSKRPSGGLGNSAINLSSLIKDNNSHDIFTHTQDNHMTVPRLNIEGVGPTDGTSSPRPSHSATSPMLIPSSKLEFWLVEQCWYTPSIVKPSAGTNHLYSKEIATCVDEQGMMDVAASGLVDGYGIGAGGMTDYHINPEGTGARPDKVARYAQRAFYQQQQLKQVPLGKGMVPAVSNILEGTLHTTHGGPMSYTIGGGNNINACISRDFLARMHENNFRIPTSGGSGQGPSGSTIGLATGQTPSKGNKGALYTRLDEDEARAYQHFEVVKTNKYGTEQERVIGIDGERIYNMKPSSEAAGKTKNPERNVSDIETLRTFPDRPRYFEIEYRREVKCDTDRIMCKTVEDCVLMVEKLKVLKKMVERKARGAKGDGRGGATAGVSNDATAAINSTRDRGMIYRMKAAFGLGVNKPPK